MRYVERWPEYAKQWDEMVISKTRLPSFIKEAEFAIKHKAQYQAIEKLTTTPWWLIALLHRRESNADFNSYLGNGDPLNKPTKNVPAGRGPFNTFEEGAVDALKIDGLDDIKDWRLEKALYKCEIFNGPGAFLRHLPSSYIWGGTNIQQPGKFIRDHVWDPRVWDIQPGCAPLLKTMMGMDPSIAPVRES